jgi:PPOX class probable F420-dependent enzyme
VIDLESEFGRAVRNYLENEYVIWLTTVDTKLTPQPRPVWFLWEVDTFLIFSQANAHKLTHIAKHPSVALHFNTDDTGDRRVVVFEREARVDPHSPPAHEVSAYFEKYREGIASLKLTPEEFSREYSTAIKITPSQVRGWE